MCHKMNLEDIPRALISSVCEFPTEYRSKMLKIALAVNQSSVMPDRSKFIKKFSNDSGIPKEHIYEILSVYIAIVRLFLEANDKEFNNKLHNIGFTTDFIENLPLISNRKEIVDNFQQIESNLNKAESIKWRIDVSLGNSSLVKKVPIGVILCITMKTGKKYTIEVDAKMFHKLRFNVALVLKELLALEQTFSTK